MKLTKRDYNGRMVPPAAWSATILLPLLLCGCAEKAAQSPGGAASQGAVSQPVPPATVQTGGVRMGVVDLQKVLVETDAGKKLRESLNTFMKSRQAVIEIEEKELKRMEEDLIKQASVLSPGAKKDREDLLRRRVGEFQQRANEMNREVQEKQKEALESFRERAERIVGKVAQQLGLTVVIEKGRGAPTVYNDSSLDISAKIIEEFNKGGS